MVDGPRTMRVLIVYGTTEGHTRDFSSRTCSMNMERSTMADAAQEPPEGLRQCVQRFTHQTEWRPIVVHHIAGAIRYSHYDFFKGLAYFVRPAFPAQGC